jgi:hypothetical protein
MCTKLTLWRKVLLEMLVVRPSSPGIPHRLWNPKVHFLVDKSLPLIPLYLVPSSGSFPSDDTSLISSMPATCNGHHIFFDSVVVIVFFEEYTLRSLSFCNLLQPLVNFSLICRNPPQYTSLKRFECIFFP